ncbi:MAG: recombinase family protein [Oligoflexales bacterium]
MKFGYARVSKHEQSLSLQIDALNHADCDEIFTDEVSGSLANRPGLEQLLSHLRAGDTLVVWKLDRLGRHIKHLIDLTSRLEAKGIHLTSITEGIETKNPIGKFFFHLMASLAQMERDITIERTKAGLDAARCRGRVGGRRRIMTESKLQSAKKLLQGGSSPKDIAKDLGVSLPTLYRWIPARSWDPKS